MAEEWGTVIFGVSDEFEGDFDDPNGVDDPASLIAKVAGIGPEKIENLILSVNKIRVRSGYVAIEYDCADWRAFSELLVAHGEGLEFYSRTMDEYGACGFFALCGDTERFSFSYDQDGDMFEVEGYEQEVEGKIGEWMSLLPDSVKDLFPGSDGDGEDDDDPFPDWPEDSELQADSDGDGHEILGTWHSPSREGCVHFTRDNRVIDFELYSEPDIMSFEWSAEDRIRVEGAEVSVQVVDDELTITRGEGRSDKLVRVDSPRILKSFDSDE